MWHTFFLLSIAADRGIGATLYDFGVVGGVDTLSIPMVPFPGVICNGLNKRDLSLIVLGLT